MNKIKEIFSDKRCNIISVIIAIIISGFQVIGTSIEKYKNLEGILDDKIRSFAYFVIFAIITYLIIVILYKVVFPKFTKKGTLKEWKFFTNNKRSFFLIAIFIFIMYIPYFLNEYPGIVSPDSMSEILQSLGYEHLGNHHPVAHIALIVIPMRIGRFAKNYNLGIGIYSVFQMIFTAGVFSYTLYFMAKHNVNKIIRIIALIIYAIYPPFAIYSVTMWKDIPFGLAMVLYILSIVDLALDNEKIKDIKFDIKFVILMILVFLFRNNGIYVLLLTLPFFIFSYKGYRKRIGMLYLITFGIYVIFTGPIFKIFNITKSNPGEALSIPLQQFARVSIYHQDTLTEEEKTLIKECIPVESIKDAYNPICSDPIKINFSVDEWKKNKKEIIKLYGKFWIKYPRASLESALCECYGYWYPNTKGAVTYYDFILASDIKDDRDSMKSKLAEMNQKKSPIVKIKLCDDLKAKTNDKKLSILTIGYSIGFVFWLIMIAFGYAIYKKQYKLSIAYIPIFTLWLTTCAGPLSSEYRYVYSLFTTFPLLEIANIDIVNRKANKELKK